MKVVKDQHQQIGDYLLAKKIQHSDDFHNDYAMLVFVFVFF